MNATQQRLFREKPTIREAFEQFHAAHPEVYEHICRFARQAKARGVKRWGIKAIFEVVRWHVKVNLGRDGDYKLNNNFTSHYARLIEEREPDLAGFFEKRTLRAE